MMMISAAGGMDIEEVAISSPEKIINIFFEIDENISLDKSFQSKLDINHSQFEELNSYNQPTFISL